VIRIRVWRHDGVIAGFSVRGHSGYAEAGSDIVCAGVSAVVQTVILGLEEQLGLNLRLEAGDGYLSCSLPMLAGDDLLCASVLLETMVSGLYEISRQHEDYVAIEERGC